MTPPNNSPIPGLSPAVLRVILYYSITRAAFPAVNNCNNYREGNGDNMIQLDLFASNQRTSDQPDFYPHSPAMNSPAVNNLSGRLFTIQDIDATVQPYKDAHCLACGFEMSDGRYVGLCPQCGSDRWYRTRLTPSADCCLKDHPTCR